jgi:hypothetical protein
MIINETEPKAKDIDIANTSLDSTKAPTQKRIQAIVIAQ